MVRLFASLLLAAVCWAVFLWQVPAPQPDFDPRVTFTDLMPAIRAGGPVQGMGAELVGAWDLHSTNRDFGNYSALAQYGDGRLLAVSDKNGALLFDPPGARRVQRIAIRPLWGVNTRIERVEPDCEAIAIDPANGDIWTAYEGNTAFWVFTHDFGRHHRVAAPVLGEWPENAGPEAMTRLADGRFVVLIEAYESLFSLSRHPALLYPASPRPGQTPLRFSIAMPEGFRPVEAAALPDGRLLVLGRRITLNGFRSVIAVANPREIRAGGVLAVREIARIGDSRIRDNYEAMTATANRDGTVTIWLMSDHNIAVWLQRSLLLELRWRP